MSGKYRKDIYENENIVLKWSYSKVKSTVFTSGMFTGIIED